MTACNQLGLVLEAKSAYGDEMSRHLMMGVKVRDNQRVLDATSSQFHGRQNACPLYCIVEATSRIALPTLAPIRSNFRSSPA
jgi:hypothetical protein